MPGFETGKRFKPNQPILPLATCPACFAMSEPGQNWLQSKHANDYFRFAIENQLRDVRLASLKLNQVMVPFGVTWDTTVILENSMEWRKFFKSKKIINDKYLKLYL